MHLFHFKVKSKIILPQPKLVEVSKQLSCLSLEYFVLPSLITMKMVMLILELLVHTHQKEPINRGLPNLTGDKAKRNRLGTLRREERFFVV